MDIGVRMKRLTIYMMLIGAIALGSLTACGSVQNADTHGEETDTSIQTTFVPDEAGEDVLCATQDIFAMDTYMTLTAYGEQAKEAVLAAVEEIDRLDNLLSTEDRDSEVYRLNQKGSVTVSEDTAALIEKSGELYEDTGGAFDITIYPLMVEWGFPSKNFKVPSQSRIDRLLQCVDASKIRYDKEKKTVTLPDQVQIDLGGITKGYTSGRVMDIYRKYDIHSGLVSLGGNVQLLGKKVDGSSWRVAVEDPKDTSQYIGVLEETDKAIITSGGYERYFEEDGRVWHHILDPATGYPADSGLTSVTIVSGDGALADGLSTALFIMGKEKALDFWRKNPDRFDTILVEEDGSITVTAGIADKFTSDNTFTVAE